MSQLSSRREGRVGRRGEAICGGGAGQLQPHEIRLRSIVVARAFLACVSFGPSTSSLSPPLPPPSPLGPSLDFCSNRSLSVLRAVPYSASIRHMHISQAEQTSRSQPFHYGDRDSIWRGGPCFNLQVAFAIGVTAGTPGSP